VRGGAGDCGSVLEGGNCGTEDEVLGGADLCDRCHNLFTDERELTLEVKEWYRLERW